MQDLCGNSKNITDAMLVHDIYELQAIDKNINGDCIQGDYMLAGDIDADVTKRWNSGSGFNPIGNFTSMPFNIGGFNGSLDGAGFVIKDLHININTADGTQSNAGLFDVLNTNAFVHNLTLQDGSITNYTNSSGGSVGSIAGENLGSLKNVFNIEQDQGWQVNTERVEFDTEDGWKKYVDSKRLEITCGEAPYIVSRYDAATGELLEIRQRIGILDRKLRVVNENTDSETEWFRWVLRAYQSVYGYEFQGDSLLIARVNLLITFVDYMQDRWGRVPTDVELRKIVNVIVWNLWQMDGISGTIPFGKPKEEYHQFSLFDFVVADEPRKQDIEEPEEVYCQIYDWRSDKSLTYKSMKEGR